MKRVIVRIGQPPQRRRRRVWGWPENATETALYTLLGIYLTTGGPG